MKDRAMQALYLLALQPISETLADRNAYGFRPKRSCADAAEQCFKIFAKKRSAQWILEGDIRSCFDEINHQWLLNNIPMDKIMLSKWLKSGYMELNQFHATNLGVPQGGTISANLLTITLSGLEDVLKAATKRKDKVNLVTYADDLIISGATPEILKNIVQPLVANFIKERGLVLSDKKTLITHIDKGFDFLGFNIRKYSNKLVIKPSKKNVNRFLENIRGIIKAKATAKTENLIRILNLKIRGWGNYFRHVCSKATFSKVDSHIFLAIWKWVKRRHPKKSRQWIAKKYFGRYKGDNWIFNARLKSNQENQCKILRLFNVSSIAIKRHIKIKAAAHPYDLEYKEYFIQRARKLSSGNNYAMLI
jgi:RNA-directed DNA polymerase